MKREKITIAFASVVEALFLLLEIYFMIHAKGNFPILLIVAICMVAVLFFLVMSVIELNQKNKEKELREYEEIYKAQKASYLAQKKYFDELNERLNLLEENTNFPAEDIISAQKAVAKVTISRSKENADALMNANDELIQRVFGFEEKLADNNDALLRQQESLLQKTREELLANNQGMQEQFDMLHQALTQMKQEISDLELRQASAPVEEPQTAAEERAPIIEEMPVAEEPIVEEPMLEDLPDLEADMPLFDEEVPESEHVKAENDGEISQAEIDAMLASLASDTDEMREEDAAVVEPEIPVVEDIADLEPDMPVVEDIADAEPEIPVVDEELPLMEESVAEDAQPPIPDLSDPNKVLSPDEIAALFASM